MGQRPHEEPLTPADAKALRREHLRRVFAVAIAWALTWLTVMMLIGATIAVVDPNSIDPGEGPLMALAVFGPMGLFSSVVFAALLFWSDRTSPAATRSFARVVACSIFGTAIVQIAYLGHGDMGLLANLGEALLFCAVGAVVGALWLALARGRARPSGAASA